MAETTMTVRTSEQISNLLTQYAGTKSAGAIRATEGFVFIRRYTLHELKGLFTRAEFIALTDSQNGTMLVPEYQANKGMLIAHMDDFELLEGGVTRHEANWEKLKAKLERLTASQVFFLQDEISLFWEHTTGGDLNVFLEKYAG